MFGALAGIAWAFPFFLLVGSQGWIWIALAFILARAVVTAAMFGPQAAYFAELFPPQRRFAGFAFARELGSLLAAITAVAVWGGPETYEENITVDNTSDGAVPVAVPLRA